VLAFSAHLSPIFRQPPPHLLPLLIHIRPIFIGLELIKEGGSFLTAAKFYEKKS